MSRQKITESQRGWLLGELTQWVTESLISSDQRDRILSRYETGQETATRRHSTIVFALQSMAAFLFGLAVLLLIGFNWEVMPRLGKLLTCVAVVSATHGLGFYLRGKGQAKLSEVVFFLACLFYGCGIWLVAQAYHVEAHYPDGVWWWALGVLPFALCLDSLLLHLLFVVLMAVWAGMEVLGFMHLRGILFGWWPWPNGAFSLPLLALPGLLWAYRKASPVAVGLYVPLLAWWVILQAFAWGMERRSVFWIGSVGAMLLILAEAHRRRDPMNIPYRLWGVLLGAGALIPLSYGTFWEFAIGRRYHSPFYGEGSVITMAVTEVVAILLLVAAAFLPLVLGRKHAPGSEPAQERLRRQWYPVALAIGMAVLAFWSLMITGDFAAWLVPVVFANVAMLGLSIYLIGVGMREERTRPFAAGVLYFLVWAFVRYLDLFGTAGMLGAAALFFLCGAGLVVIARFWSKAKAARQDQGDVLETPMPYTGPDWLQRLTIALAARTRPLLLTVAVLQVLFLVGMIVQRSAPLVVGETVRLHVQPVDPRDLFRGDYVILSYDVNRLPVQGQDRRQGWGHDEGRTVYVNLEPEADGKHWRGVEASFARPASGKYLQGKIRNGMPQFGIEAFYVQEGAGREWERARNSRKLSADVAVAPWGQAALRELVAEE